MVPNKTLSFRKDGSEGPEKGGGSHDLLYVARSSWKSPAVAKVIQRGFTPVSRGRFIRPDISSDVFQNL